MNPIGLVLSSDKNRHILIYFKKIRGLARFLHYIICKEMKTLRSLSGGWSSEQVDIKGRNFLHFKRWYDCYDRGVYGNWNARGNDIYDS